MMEFCTQLLIPVLTVTGTLMIAHRDRRGWLVSLSACPFWLLASWPAHQWGVVVNTLFFAAMQVYGYRRWGRKEIA